MGKLKELLLERESDVTGGRFPPLDLKEQDPVKWEVLYTRIAGLVQNSRRTAQRISASPVVREMGECIFVLCTPEGDSVAFSEGLLIHVASIGSAIKWMLKNDYEEEEKLRPGDLFFNNDPQIGGAHSPDQLTVTPIFYQGQVIGWAGGLTHVPETGATEAGGSAPNALTRFDEGIYWPAIRIGENWTLNRNLERIVERGTRTPDWWLLDERAKATGIRLIHDGVLALIEEYGLGYYLKAIYEYIEDTRQACQRKLSGLLFPGKYRTQIFFDVPYGGKPIRYPIDHLVRVALELSVSTEGEVFIDFDGTSPPGLHPNNSSLAAMKGNIISWGLQDLFYDIKYNQGIAQTLTEDRACNIPPSVINPVDPYFATSLFLTSFGGFNTLVLAEGRACYPSGYRECILAGHSPMCSMRCGGIDQYGRRFGGSLFEVTSAGMGAQGVLDGLDTAYIIFNPVADCSDAEMWERMFPIVFLGRRMHPDSGFGKYRGGCGIESLYVMENTDQIALGSSGAGDRSVFSPGVMGGYPSPAAYRYIVRHTNLMEAAAKRLPLPHDEGLDAANPDFARLLEGETILTDAQTLFTDLERHDIWQQINGDGAGYGDPIERDPERVQRDLGLELVTLRSAEKVYCVKVDPQTLEIDHEGTKRLREQRREERLARGIPTREYLKRVREQVVKGELPRMPKTCLNQCLGNSEKFRREFREAWDLPADFQRVP